MKYDKLELHAKRIKACGGKVGRTNAGRSGMTFVQYLGVAVCVCGLLSLTFGIAMTIGAIE